MKSLLFLSILPRNSPQDVSLGCDKKSCTSCVKDDSADVVNHDIEHIGESSEKLFCEVSALRESDTPDVLRSALHDVLDTLSYFFRAYPTLPSDPSIFRKP